MDGMFVSPHPYSRVKTLTPNVTALGGGAFGRRSGYEGGALTSGVSPLIKGTQRALSPSSQHVRTQREGGSLPPRRGVPPEPATLTP